ncbi:MAG TPA: hypothetical protein DDZ41_09260, partial [Flavobacterium sp.]|nr:hypothetical protein [Flavobacterium sp.]
ARWTFLLFILSYTIANAQSSNYTSLEVPSNGRLQLLDFGGYSAGKSSEYLFGPITDFSIKNFINYDNLNNGFTWGAVDLQPVASLSIGGNFKSYTLHTRSGYASSAYNASFPNDPSAFLANKHVSVAINPIPYAIKQDYNGITHLNSDSNLLSFNINDITKARYNNAVNNMGGFFVEYLGIGEDKIIPGTALTVDGKVYISDHMKPEERGFLSLDSTNPKLANYLLWVEEGIVTKDLVLSKIADWPDYVFKEDYKLSKLKELENFINANGHLPSMPPAKIIEKEGFTAVEMNKNLVKTIEELTLYAIQQDKTIEKQNEVIESLLQRTEQLLNIF